MKAVTTPAAPKRGRMYYHLDQVEASGLLSPERMTALKADIEGRMGKAFTVEGHLITNATVATFPDGRRMLYSHLTHDPQNTYCQRDLLEALLTDAEVALINSCLHNASSERREAERFAKAPNRVNEREWSGGVFWGDTYYEDVDEFWDAWTGDYMEWDSVTRQFRMPLDSDVVRPTYLWAARPRPVIPSLDVSDVVDHYLSEAWEDADVDDLEGVPAFQAALDAFFEANAKVLCYEIDYTTVVLLDPPALVS